MPSLGISAFQVYIHDSFFRCSKMNRPHLYHVQLVLVYLLATGPIVIQSQTPSDDVWKRIIEDSYKAGPYNSFCNRTEPTEELPEDPTGTLFPCQLQCSCDPFTCGSKLPCCPDILENTVTTRNSSCLYPVMSKQPYNMFNYPKRHVQFPIRMVHDCAEGYIGTALHEKCLNFRSTTDLDHMIPVISNKTGIVYVNRFCAECSDELNFTAFESYFACWNTLFDEDNWEFLVLERTLENELKLIQEGFCVYVFKPSEEQRVEENKCLQVDYNTCNQTGKWDFEDPYFEAACDAYELPYWGLDTVYRNYHCAVCNERLSLKNRPLCVEVNQFVLRISFYALINLDLTDVIGSDLISTEHDKQRCGNESFAIFDNYLVSFVLLLRSIENLMATCIATLTLFRESFICNFTNRLFNIYFVHHHCAYDLTSVLFWFDWCTPLNTVQIKY